MPDIAVAHNNQNTYNSQLVTEHRLGQKGLEDDNKMLEKKLICKH